MYQFLMGFACGIYLGTRYDLEPYVTTLEQKISGFAKDLEAKRNEKATKEKVQEKPVSLIDSVSGFFSSEKK